MNIYKPFEKGTVGLLKVVWTMRLESPLVIKAVKKAAIKFSTDKSKGRGKNAVLEWMNPDDKIDKTKKDKEYFELGDFNYEFVIDGDQLNAKYVIPASSIRGSLRNAIIKRWIEPDVRNLFSLPQKGESTIDDIKATIEKARTHLTQKKDKYYQILSLFGLALDDSEYEDNKTVWASRLKLDVLLNSSTETHVTYSGEQIQDVNMPKNISLNIAHRGPVDAVTMGAKKGGLHTWLEMTEGQTFTIIMRILNPQEDDLSILSEWIDGIDDGVVRFGSSVGGNRGKVKIINQAYSFYVSRLSDLSEKIIDTKHQIQKIDDHLFEDIWVGASFNNIAELSGGGLI